MANTRESGKSSDVEPGVQPLIEINYSGHGAYTVRVEPVSESPQENSPIQGVFRLLAGVGNPGLIADPAYQQGDNVELITAPVTLGPDKKIIGVGSFAVVNTFQHDGSLIRARYVRGGGMYHRVSTDWIGNDPTQDGNTRPLEVAEMATAILPPSQLNFARIAPQYVTGRKTGGFQLGAADIANDPFLTAGSVQNLPHG